MPGFPAALNGAASARQPSPLLSLDLQPRIFLALLAKLLSAAVHMYNLAVQRTRGITRGDVRIAYEVLGSGPDVLVVCPPYFSHLDYDWQTPERRAFYEAVACGRRVIRYDRRGTGLSDRTVAVHSCSPEVDMRDCLAVMDAAGVERASFFGLSGSGPTLIMLAASHRERADRVILYGTYARMRRAPDYPIGQPEERSQALISLIRSDWGLGSRVLADVFIPEADAAQVAWFTAYQRIAATAEVTIAWLEACDAIDVRHLLSQVACPVLVAHRRQDRVVPFALGEYMAARLPNAALCPLEGEHHIPYLGDTASVVTAVNRFLARPGAAPRALSGREREVLKLVADGLSNRDVAAQLCLSEATVTRHFANVFTKIGVNSRAAAVAYAFRHGLM